MEIKVETDQNIARIFLKGRFDFSTHRDFRSAIDSALEMTGVRKIVINFSGLEYLDSSALGMLLILRDKAQAANKTVELSGAKQSVAQVLEIANFKKLFTIT